MSARFVNQVVSLTVALGLCGMGSPALASAPGPDADVDADVSAEPEGVEDPDTPIEADDEGVGDPDEEIDTTEAEDELAGHLVLDPEEAKRENAALAFREGDNLYQLGKYPEAIEQFNRAWDLSKEVLILYNIGQAHWKWYDVDPDLDHLRQAAVFFRNYDKRMRLTEGYDPREVENYLQTIETRIELEERKIAEANRPVIVQPGGPTEEEIAWEQRRRATRGMIISGNIVTVLGAVTLATGVGGLLARTTYKVVLDNSTPSDGGINVASADEDKRRRDGYTLGGEIAFGALIAAAVVLPVGIGLRVAGAVRDKKDRRTARERDEERERNMEKAKKVAFEPSAGGFTLRF